MRGVGGVASPWARPGSVGRGRPGAGFAVQEAGWQIWATRREVNAGAAPLFSHAEAWKAGEGLGREDLGLRRDGKSGNNGEGRDPTDPMRRRSRRAEAKHWRSPLLETEQAATGEASFRHRGGAGGAPAGTGRGGSTWFTGTTAAGGGLDAEAEDGGVEEERRRPAPGGGLRGLGAGIVRDAGSPGSWE
ncbi:hypothetical protein TRIUR3_30122 [Triticum urartu]|uniref:Uncharacterized protein n=1 Tax=Triticum urartu TaxID=4572 RepID=M7ZSX9_TRIUA|nr:hypothetical protein TRIUR3_30122 [Triticum urartu]